MLGAWRARGCELGPGVFPVRLPQGGHSGPTAHVIRPTETQGPGWLSMPTGGCHLNRKESPAWGGGWRGGGGALLVLL